MKTSVVLPVHSFVDVITNSSSEIFVAANKNTVSAIKKLVENIVSATGGSVNADDLFTFELVYTCYDGSYDEVFLTEEEVEKKRKELDEIISNPDKYSKDEVTEAEEWVFCDGNDDGYPRCSVRVEVKNKGSKEANAAARVLSDLTGLFNIEAING